MTLMPPDVPDLDDTLQTLLAPVPGPDPCGVSLRGQALFTDIRLAREEEDPSLPLRQWERPLKQADWPRIEGWCTEALTARSKDLQLAAWLAEAWTRQEAGIAGLARGLSLLRGLVDAYWAGVYPRLDPPEEGGGCEARIAPFEWLDATMAHALRVHVCLFPLARPKPARVSLADWERLIAGELAGVSVDPATHDGESEPHGVEPALTRDDILADVARHQPEGIDDRLAQVREARAHLVALGGALDRHLDADAPRLRKLAQTLDALERVLVQARAALPAGEPKEAGASALYDEADEAAQCHEGLDPEGGSAASMRRPVSQEASAPPSTGSWHNRDEAYQTLEALARYLATIEPHSPTPYLVQRAVNWGRLPLPELIAEIMREEGDLNRMVQLLGLSR